MAVAAVSPASADKRVMVPDNSSGPALTGCWDADRNLYGPYRLRFCLNGYEEGTYRVKGGGHTCHGRLSWTRDPFWGGPKVQLSEASCSGGTEWTADRFTCALKGGGDARVMVDSRRLECTYVPAVAGYGWKFFQANRS
jgi:hypothetical protein